jgi:hypothetical protein
MIPSLFTFTLLAGLVLLAAGLPFLAAPARIEKAVLAFPRHRMAGIVLMLMGGAWFLWKITQLGQSDFGDYKIILLVLFAATLVGSILYVPDFLAVRGLAILILLSANTGVKAAFGLYDIPERLVLVTIIYIFIICALVFGIMPYKMRDFLNGLYRKSIRVRLFGAVLVLMSLALFISAFQY